MKPITLAEARIVEGILKKMIEFNVPEHSHHSKNSFFIQHENGEKYYETHNPTLKLECAFFMRPGDKNYKWMTGEYNRNGKSYPGALKLLESRRLNEIFAIHKPNKTVKEIRFILKSEKTDEMKGFVIIQLDAEAVPYLLRFAKSPVAAKIGIVPMLTLRCKYTPIFIFQLLRSGKIEMDLTEWHNLLCLPESSRRWETFRRVILEKVKAELSQTELAFDYAVTQKKGKKNCRLEIALEKEHVLSGVLVSRYGLSQPQIEKILTSHSVPEIKEKLAYIDTQVKEGKVKTATGIKTQVIGSGATVVNEYDSVSGGYTAKIFGV